MHSPTHSQQYLPYFLNGPLRARLATLYTLYLTYLTYLPHLPTIPPVYTPLPFSLSLSLPLPGPRSGPRSKTSIMQRRHDADRNARGSLRERGSGQAAHRVRCNPADLPTYLPAYLPIQPAGCACIRPRRKRTGRSRDPRDARTGAWSRISSLRSETLSWVKEPGVESWSEDESN